jgi:hypothetical protein
MDEIVLNPAVAQTLAYIDAIKHGLQVTVTDGKATCLLSNVTPAALRQVKSDLDDILRSTEAARESVARSEGAILQTASFGYSADLDLTLRAGFLLGDRVVLWDYLWRTLGRGIDAFTDDKRSRIAAIATGIVEVEELARLGHVVLLPHPLDWSKDASAAVQQAANREGTSLSVAALTATISAAAVLGVHSFSTVDERLYGALVESGPVKSSQGDQDTLITGLLSQRLLTDKRFRYLKNVPLGRYRDEIASNADFYRQIRDRLAASSESDAAYRLRVLSDELDTLINSQNATFTEVAKSWALTGGILGAVVGVLNAPGSTHPLMSLTGAAISLTTALARTVGVKPQTGMVLASVFRALKRTATEELDAFERGLEELEGEPAEMATHLLCSFSPESAAEIVHGLRATTISYVISSGDDYLENYLATVRNLDENAYWNHLRVGLNDDDVAFIALSLEYLANNTPANQFAEMPDDLRSLILSQLVHARRVADLEDTGVPRFLRAVFAEEKHLATTNNVVNAWLEHLRPREQRVFTLRLKRIISARQQDLDDEEYKRTHPEVTPESPQKTAELMEALRRALDERRIDRKHGHS